MNQKTIIILGIFVLLSIGSIFYILGNSKKVTQGDTESVKQTSVFSDKDFLSFIDNDLGPENNYVDLKNLRFLSGAVDLNFDGKNEYFYLIRDQYFCGSGGCNLYLFNSDKTLNTNFSVSERPIFYTEEKTNGWRDIVVYSGGSLRLLSFDGKKYPSNPSLAPKTERNVEAAVAKVLEDEAYIQDGKNLTYIEPNTYDELPLVSSFEEYYFTWEHFGDPDNLYDSQIILKNNLEK